MITLNWGSMDGEIGALMARFDELPRYIAKKHLIAAVRRAGKEGVPKLKSNTPVGRKLKPNAKGVVKMRKTGDLRRAAKSLARYKGRNRDGYVQGVLGYKFGWESRKAIWLEEGTVRIAPRKMIGKTMQSWKGPLASKLAAEMALALEKAAKELDSGKHPGIGYRRVTR
jgi:HK97 gp10 family phage protein